MTAYLATAILASLTCGRQIPLCGSQEIITHCKYDRKYCAATLIAMGACTLEPHEFNCSHGWLCFVGYDTDYLEQLTKDFDETDPDMNHYRWRCTTYAGIQDPWYLPRPFESCCSVNTACECVDAGQGNDDYCKPGKSRPSFIANISKSIQRHQTYSTSDLVWTLAHSSSWRLRAPLFSTIESWRKRTSAEFQQLNGRPLISLECHIISTTSWPTIENKAYICS